MSAKTTISRMPRSFFFRAHKQSIGRLVHSFRWDYCFVIHDFCLVVIYPYANAVPAIVPSHNKLNANELEEMQTSKTLRICFASGNPMFQYWDGFSDRWKGYERYCESRVSRWT